MAFTATQKAEIIFNLGYASRILDTTSLDYNKIFADRLDGHSAESESIISKLLRQIKDVRDKLLASQDIMKVKRVGDIELNNDENMLLRKDLKRLLKDLAFTLDIPLRKSGGVNVSVCL